MTEEKKLPSRGKQIARSIRRHLVNYFFIAVAGSLLIVVASAMLKAHLVKKPLENAAEQLKEEKYDELLESLNKSSRGETLYPSLKPRRDNLAIRCYARKNNLGHAMGIADAMVSTSLPTPSFIDWLKDCIPPASKDTIVDRFAYFMQHLEKPVAVLINNKFRKQNIEMGIGSWSGYKCLSDELKAAQNEQGLEKLLQICKEYHPKAAFTESLEKFVQNFRGKAIPHPDADAPIGWAMIKKENVTLYDKSGDFLTKATRGTIIEVDEVRDSNSGEIVIGSMKYRDNQKPGVVALVKDLTLKRGLLFEIDETVLDKLYTRAELTRKIADAEERARKEAADANPYAAEYRKLSAEYKKLWAEADRAKAKFKSSTGAEREKYADKLRTLKPRNVALTSKIKAVKAKYQAWQKANGSRSATSPEAAQLTNQLRQVESELRKLGYL